MHDIVVISGKGGTGKTSLTAAFAYLAGAHVLCDLDVDAPDLHLLLDPANQESHEFFAGNTAVINDRCDHCGQCVDWCRFGAIMDRSPQPVVDAVKCEGCNVCVALCPADAIDFPEKHCGHWHVADTRFGPLVHAQLFPGEENSGRLVTLLKRKARDLAQVNGTDLILSDGPPGIGCPVISALAGTSLAVIVTEPTPSGIHDLDRVLDLCGHFRLPAGVIINKHDLNRNQSRNITACCRQRGVPVIGTLSHDPALIRAMVAGLTICEYQSGGVADQVRTLWAAVESLAGVAVAQPETAPISLD